MGLGSSIRIALVRFCSIFYFRKQVHTNLITIKFNTQKPEFLEFIIYNFLGQTVGHFELDSNNLQLNLSYLSNGLYYYHIKSKGEIISKNNIIKRQ